MADTMRALLKSKPGPGLELARLPVPEVGPDEVLIRIQAASVCGTDLKIQRWDAWAAERMRPPVIVGHELCGEVVEQGSEVSDPPLGAFVSAESHIIDNTCEFCLTGRRHLCTSTEIIGVDRDGGFAEYIVLPAANVWVNPAELPVEIAVFLENLGNAVHAVFSLDLPSKRVLVTGCGPVGLMSIAVAKAVGARDIYASDLHPYRLDLARKMGADLAVDARREDVVSVVREATGGTGVDAILEMSGASAAIDQGFQLLKPGGEAALLGLPPGPVEFDIENHLVFKGATARGIIGRRLWETWYQMEGLLASGGLDLQALVTHHFPLEEYEAALATMASGKSGKVILYPHSEKETG
ncbi:MAG: L-threonine 3-dehydrogenase [Anaerolineae bacterium]